VAAISTTSTRPTPFCQASKTVTPPVGAVADPVQQLGVREPFGLRGGDRSPLECPSDDDVAGRRAGRSRELSADAGSSSALPSILGLVAVGWRQPHRGLPAPADCRAARGSGFKGNLGLTDEEVSELSERRRPAGENPLKLEGRGLAPRPPTHPVSSCGWMR
jgi:hypothetical protein